MSDQFPSLLFHVNWPSHSWDTAISKFDYENPWSMFCVWSKVKVILLAQQAIDLLPTIGPAIPEIQLFKNLTLKIQGQDHGQGQTHWSHLKPGIQSIHYYYFFFRQSDHIANSIFDFENSRSRSRPRSNPMVTFEAKSSIDMCAFHLVSIRPGNSKFHIWHWKFKVTVIMKKNRLKSNQVIYRSGWSIVPKMKEIWKFVRKLLHEQKSAAGNGTRTGKKTQNHNTSHSLPSNYCELTVSWDFLWESPTTAACNHEG